MLQKEITIINKLGLHARAAAKLVGVAQRFGCSISLKREDKHCDAKSIMAVMMMAASQGTVITLCADGNDEELAMDALCELINNRFDEPE